MLKSFLVGALFAAVLGTLTLGLSGTHVATVFLVPGMAIANAIHLLIPSSDLWVVPAGALQWFLLVGGGWAFLFWTVVFGIIHRQFPRK